MFHQLRPARFRAAGYPDRPRAASRGVVLVAALLAALLVVGAPTAGAALRALQAADDPSPAQGHAEVIAQGVAILPADEVAWRVVIDTAEPEDEAEIQERALGFALAEEDAVLINDSSFGTQTRLATGEASFVAEGVQQQRLSLGDTATDYYRIALVGTDQAGDDGGDDLIFSGDGFAAPDGRRDLDLVRDVLDPREETEIADAGTPVLIVATSGEIEVLEAGADEDDAVSLEEGEAAEFEGDLTIAAIGETGAIFVAAAVGPEVPAPPAPPTGSIALGVFACAAGVTPDAIVGATGPTAAIEACAPLTEDQDFDIVLTAADGTEIGLADTTVAGGVYTYAGLFYGSYDFSAPLAQPAGFPQFLFTDFAGQPLDEASVTINETTPDVRANLYFFAAETGSVSLRVLICPPGATADDFEPADCGVAPSDAGAEVELRGGADAGVVLTLADAEFDGTTYTFADFPISTVTEDADDPAAYLVVETTLPSGYDNYVVAGTGAAPGEDPVIRLTPDAPTAEVEIYNFQADVEETGSLTVQVLTCAEGIYADTFDASACTQVTEGFDFAVYTPGGDVFTVADATANGDGTVTFTDLPLAGIDIEQTAFPAGYVAFYNPDATQTPLVNRRMYRITLTAESPNATIELYNFLPVPDTDGDGADDQVEAANGTNPNVPDTDGDGLGDGVELENGTDGTNPDTDGDGVDDGNEVANGTDPTEAD